MSESHAAPANTGDIDPQELTRAHDMWERFTRSMKFGAIAIAIGVIILAWITL